MAKKLNYEIGFTGDTKQLQQAIDTAVKSLQKLGTNSSFQLTSGLKEASKSALDLATNLQKAVNQDTGKLDLIDFEKSLKSSGKSLTQYADELSKLGPQGQQAFLNVASAITQAELPLKRSNKLMTELWVTMKNTARWQLTSSALHGFMGALSTAYGYSKDLNRSLTDIRIVSGQSAEEMKEFAEQANKAAKALNATTVDYTDAALIYYQQGLDQDAVEERTNATIKMANVTGETAQTVSDQMTAIWNNYDDGSKKLEYYADVITALGAATASSSGEIAQGLEKFSAIAGQVGLSYEYATSALATVTATTRESADVVGTAFKTLFARIQGLSLGETMDDGTNLNKYSEALQKVGISIFEQNGELKAMDKILDEMGSKWDTLSNAQQVALAQTVAGVRQYNQLMTLMGHWDFFKENLAVAKDSEGELQKQADIYAESWEAARDRVRASAEDIYDSIINPDLFIKLDNTLTPILSTVADLIDGMGGLEGAVTIAAYAFTKLYGYQIQEGLRKTADNIRLLMGQAQEASRNFQRDAFNTAADLTISYTADKNLQTKIDIMQQEVALQGAINEKAASLDAYQMQYINQEKEKIALLREEYLSSSQLVQQAQQEIETLSNNIYFDISLDEGWQDNIKAAIGEANLEEVLDISKITNADEAFNTITSKIGELSKSSVKIDYLKNRLGSLDKITEENANSFRKAAVNLGLLTQEEANAADTVEKLKQSLTQVQKEAQNNNDTINKLGKALTSLGADSNAVSRYISKLKELEIQLKNNQLTQEQFNQQVQELTNRTLNGQIPTINDWATKLTNASNALMQVAMGIQAVQSIGRVFTDENLSDIDRLNQLLMATVMLIPVVTTAWKAYVPVATAVANSEKLIGIYCTLSAAAESKNILVRGGATAATKILEFATKDLSKAYLRFLGIIGIAAIAIYGAVKLYDYFTISIKEANEMLEDANSALDESTSKLEELNSELETTKNRIQELQEQDSLTIIESQELAKLKQTVQLLERQKVIEEANNKNLQKNKSQIIDKTWDTKAYEISAASAKVKTSRSDLDYYLAKENFSTLEEAKISGSQELKNRIQTYEKELTNYINENSQLLQDIEDNYFYQLQSMYDGIIDFDESALNKYQEDLKLSRLSFLDNNEDEYFKIYIAPILETKAWKDAISKDRVVEEILKSGKSKNIQKYITADLRLEFNNSGVNIDEYFDSLEINADKLNKILGYNANQILDSLTSNEIEILLNMDLDKIEGLEELWPIILQGRKEAIISISVITEVQDSATEALKLLTEGEELQEEHISRLQSAFSQFYDLNNLVGASSYHQAEMIHQAVLSFQEEINSTLETSTEKFNEAYTQYSALMEKYNNQQDTDKWYNNKDLDKDKLLKAELELDLTNAYAQLEELSNFELDPLEIDILGVESTTAKLKAVETATALISKDLKVTADDLETLAKTMPQLLASASIDYTKGIVQLNKTVVEGEMAAAKELLRVEQENNAKKLENHIQTGIGILTSTQTVNEAVRMSSDETVAKSLSNSSVEKADKISTAKAILKEKLKQAIKERKESAVTASNSVADANAAADGTKDAGQTMVENWEKAFQAIGKMSTTLYQGISNQQKLAAGGEAVGEISIKADISSFKTASGEFKPIYDTELAGKYQAMEDFIDSDFTDYGADKGDTYSERRELRKTLAEGFEELGYNLTEHNFVTQQTFLDAFYKSYGSDKQAFKNDIAMAQSAEGGRISNALAALQDLLKGAGYNQIGKNDKGGRGGGGGSSSKSAEDESKALERYHEINRTLEDQERLLSELETQAERTFGLDRLKLYEKELEEINKKAAYEQMKMAEAGTYLNKDIQAIRDLGLNVQVDAETKEITNWTAIMNQATAEYKAAIAGATDEEAQAVKDMYDNRIKAIEQYEESIDTFQEQQQKVWDALREARDMELRNTTYKLDVLLTVKNMKDAAREFSQEVVESFSDKWYHGYASAELGAEGARAEMALLGEYQQQQADLQKLLDNADEFTSTEDIIAEMEELQGNVIASGEALLDWIETVETMLPEAIDAARERFSLFTDQLDHNTSVLDTIKELLSLQGVTYKTSRGFNTLQEVSQEKLDAAVASAELQRGWMERARTELLEAQRALEQVEEGDAAYDTLKNNRDALLEEYNSAQAAMLESAQEAMEMAREMFLTEIEKASYDFSKAISDGLGLDLLQERYDHLIEEEERYLDEVNTTYEQLKWNSKLQTAIDEASSLASKNALKNLQEEFEQRKKNGEISQYDLDILNAKYEMTQKQIALEEAQNNKSQVRLVRNSQGNWDYQYTSDQSTIDNANQEYADAANEYYNIAKDQVKDVTEEIVATWQECNEKVKEVYEDETLTVAEREAKIAEIREFYSEKILYLEEQKNNALKDMTAAGGEIIGEYGNTYQDVINLMQDGTADFNEAFNEYLDDMENAWNDYDETVGDVADSTGTEMGDLRDIIDEVSESTDDCREVGAELSEMMWDQMEDIRELSQDYANWAEEIYSVVEALEALAIAQGQAVEEASKESTSKGNVKYNPEVDYALLLKQGLQLGAIQYNDSTYRTLADQRDAKIDDMGLNYSKTDNLGFENLSKDSINKDAEIAFFETLKNMKIPGFNTGGYTGEFPDGKLAFLHEKELVLNQSDTGNILTAVNAVRTIGPTLFKQIEAVLDGNAMAGANLLGMKMSNAVSADSTSQELVQHIEVTAEFPNATDQNEIREAILGLANYATQVVNPR